MVKRWNIVEGQMDFLGEASIKFDNRHRGLLDRAKFLAFNGYKWDFSSLRDPGQSLGQPRIILAVTRKE